MLHKDLDFHLLSNYVNLAMEITDAPELYHISAFITSFAALCGKRVWYGDTFRIFPNLYTLLVGPSAMRKSTSIRIIQNIFQEIYPRRVLPNEFSHEWLLGALSKSPQSILFLSEFAALAGLLTKTYMAGTKETITDLWDCPAKYIRNTKATNYTINSPTLNILSASTPEWISKHFTPEDFRAGFFARFLVVWCEEKLETRTFLGQVPQISFKNITTDIITMLKKTRGRMEIVDKLSSDTPGIFEDWYKAHEKTIDQQPFSLKSLWERMPTNVIKLSIIFAAIDGAQTITYRHLNAAQTYADTLLSRLKKLSYKLATSDEDRNIKVVYEIIKGYKNIRRSDLIRKSSMTSKTLDIYVDTLLDSKLITKNRVDTGRKPATEYRITEY